MIDMIMKVVDCNFARGFRLSILLGTAVILFVAGISGRAQSTPAQYADMQLASIDHIANEHRFSVLETQMSGMKEKIDDLTLHSYLELLALSGIIGETGIRILKGKRGG